VVLADNAKTVEKTSAVEETSGFKQAKTIEEAEKFALENGVRHVDYSDLPLETANLLNEAAMTLPEDIRPAYIGSGKSVQKVTGKKFPRKEKEYYGVHMDVLQMHFGEYPNIEYDFEGGNVVGISTAYKTPEKIHKSKVEGNKAYAEKHDGHTQFFNEDGRSTAFHEMGHIYADKKGIPEGFASDAERWLKESKCDMLKSTDEAWAEAWGAYHTKNPDLPDYIAEYVEKVSNAPIDKSAKGGIIKSENLKMSAPLQKPPDFSKYEVKSDLKTVEAFKETVSAKLGIPISDISLDGIRNTEVLEPFINRIEQIQKETGMKMPALRSLSVIDGDETCIAGYKRYENTLYISSKYFNSKDALVDTLKEWANNGTLPKQGKTIRYLAEHETAHIRIPASDIESEEGFEIFRKAMKRGLCENDKNIYEFYADCEALDRMGYSDKNIQDAVEYLKRRRKK
jgi:hypothetical protein